MRSSIWLVAAALAVIPALHTHVALAETPAAALALAKQAYAEVDYERTRELAAAAIKGGGNDRATTEELYWLWGTAAAALDHSEEAVDAFLHALAQNPELKLDRGLSPKLRAPYLEARGKLGVLAPHAPLEVTLERRHEQLEIRLHDALGVAGAIELGAREPGATRFSKRRLSAAPMHELPKPRGSELSFYARVLDRYGNVLLELGTPTDPRRLALVRSTRPAVLPSNADRSPQSPTAYYVVAGSLAALGATAGGLATAMYLKREQAARDWNSDACERPGTTRAQQCADVDDRRQRSENWAMGLTATGGALLVGGVVTLLLAPRGGSKANVSVEANAREVSLSWKTAL